MWALTLPAQARLGCKVLMGTNTLAFKKISKLWISFITFGQGLNVINLFAVVI